MRLKAKLLLVIDTYAKAAGVPESAVSRLLFGSGNRVRGLRGKADMRSGGIEDALQKLSDHWPEGAAWPCEVMRPAPSALQPSDQSEDSGG